MQIIVQNTTNAILTKSVNLQIAVKTLTSTLLIEVDYLNGQEIPNIRRMETPGQLGLIWDIFLDWGISVMDFRGGVKNPGVEVKTKLELA